MSAMKESKDFRSGTRLLQWEKEKLSMEYEDLQMKWTEIQQTKVKQLINNTIGNSDKSNSFVLIYYLAHQRKQAWFTSR